MVKFSKTIRDFLSATGDITKFLTKIPDGSSGYIVPGDVLLFRYWMPATVAAPGSFEQRAILIVKNRRASDGIFTSTQNNVLVSSFKLSGESSTVIETVIENLYKKRRRASYWGKIKGSLRTLLGKDSYRTYNIDKMKQVYSVNYKGINKEARV